MHDSILPIQLSVGWPILDPAAISARIVHGNVLANAKEQSLYAEELKSQLMLNYSAWDINFDQLLRRHTRGFDAINTFTAALLSIWADLPDPKSCNIDIFAYAFLKHAKNYDFFMRPDPENLGQLQIRINGWQQAVQALEDFERLGVDLPAEYSHLKQVYLPLRAIISRPAARDEQLALAVLLVCGPLTKTEISSDLGLNYSLNQRIMAALQMTGVIDSRPDGGETRYLINDAALPVCLFVVREIIGLDLLTMVADL